MCWQPQLGRMGMKVEGAGKKRLFSIGSSLYQALVRPDLYMIRRYSFGKVKNGCITRPNPCST